MNKDDELCSTCTPGPLSDVVKIQRIGLIVYGDLVTMLVADEPLSQEEWRARIDEAAVRSDHIENMSDTELDPTEVTAYDEGLAALLCYRHSDLRQEWYVGFAPRIDGW